MLSVKDIQSVYFIGIGGIGMSALARYFNALGKTVSGYDKTPTPLTQQLEAEGIAIHFEENLTLIPQRPDLVVYTPAVPKQHAELLYYQQQEVPVLKRSEVLGIISNSSFNICIGGTHGKTTTTTMTAHVLRHTGYGCNAFLGGISVNYQTNFWSDPRNVAVIEADEYDRSFLRLHPDIAVISSMDPDHLDIYGTEKNLQDAFIEFSQKLKPQGLLFSKYGLPRSSELKAGKHFTYSLDNTNADIYAKDIRMQDGSYSFSVKLPDIELNDVALHMGGLHNVENALVAIAIAQQLGISPEKIKEAIAAFKGVKRRFEYVVKSSRMVFVDDYAHHPEELNALINGAKALFPDRVCTVIFQPHLYSRTHDLSSGFAKALNQADKVLLLPIYPARELPMEGVESALIANQMQAGKVQLIEKAALLNHIKETILNNKDQLHLLITAGAGDIDALVLPIAKLTEDHAG
ncbi:UDP-N-acetylmuramate--L-alanine ligase [Flavihumibacter sp. RY-1]|uniref:UDP-N-acetylmuramate--L-alanine ligase n=1 Tax=Flavihumibacter fluminis TaxID=2909236 RepID=A0ABS9BM20_9BACT|nr:UDP-N-acetylmuramate--L-alanine ligase [Flavihumibacter fluminis]MCF1716048.1 UDP-N-acetylmuramate--L-alanine ligase [Flavihumibacter fluminis]